MANKYPANPSEMASEATFPVKVYFCPECKNIQLDTSVSRETMFVDYYYLSSVNKALVSHYEKFAHEKLWKSKFVLDIGSNDGISLKPLKEMGVQCLGIDPSENVGVIANAAGYETVVDFFNAESAKNIRAKYGRPDVITGLSMFSHLQNPHVFLEDVKSLLTDNGKFIVEVEYNAEILRTMAFERFYLDRIFYFSVTSFHKLFELHDMHLADVEMTDIHGGSLRVTAKKGLKAPKAKIRKYLEREKYALTPIKVAEFGLNAHQQVKALRKKLVDYKIKKYSIAGYGAPARLSTITNLGHIGPDIIDFIVDDSPLKQGRFSPGQHIPIVGLEYLETHRPNVLVVFAFDYFPEIRKKLKGHYRYLFPIPPREVK